MTYFFCIIIFLLDTAEIAVEPLHRGYNFTDLPSAQNAAGTIQEMSKMAKQLLFNEDARRRLLAGVEQISR
ncbi:MAG: hypothetical protein LBG90_06425, partial [Spirochaetaceae bacterium]|nr:hypothetical protein [Spirochaetaceae bacterium]